MPECGCLSAVLSTGVEYLAKRVMADRVMACGKRLIHVVVARCACCRQRCVGAVTGSVSYFAEGKRRRARFEWPVRFRRRDRRVGRWWEPGSLVEDSLAEDSLAEETGAGVSGAEEPGGGWIG